MLELAHYDFKVSMKKYIKRSSGKSSHVWTDGEFQEGGEINKRIKWNARNKKYDIISWASKQSEYIKERITEPENRSIDISQHKTQREKEIQ